MIECAEEEIHAKHLHLSLPPLFDTGSGNGFTRTIPHSMVLPLDLEEAERLVIREALKMTNSNVAEAARLLKTNRMRIYRVLNSL